MSIKNNKQDLQIQKLDLTLKNVCVKVDKILDNHLPSLDKKIDRILYLIITTSLAIIGLLIKQMF